MLSKWENGDLEHGAKVDIRLHNCPETMIALKNLKAAYIGISYNHCSGFYNYYYYFLACLPRLKLSHCIGKRVILIFYHLLVILQTSLSQFVVLLWKSALSDLWWWKWVLNAVNVNNQLHVYFLMGNILHHLRAIWMAARANSLIRCDLLLKLLIFKK